LARTQPPPLRPGDKVTIRPGKNHYYQGGLRSGVVVSVTERFGDYLRRMEKELGERRRSMRLAVGQRADLPPGYMKRCLPVVAIDATERVPQFELAIEARFLEAVPEEQKGVSP
jgi:hypothetical protein